MDERWRVELFGGLRARQGERVVTRFRTQKIAALLAYLAYHHDRKHPRETLYEVVWTECAPDAGRNNLRVALSSLRRQLEPPGVPAGAVIVADRVWVGLNPAAVTTDVAEFEAALKSAARTGSDAERAQHLTTAVELYRGELLHGFFEEWIDAERQRLADAYLNALRRLTKLLGQAREFDRALDYARRAVTTDPLHEASHRAVMRLYAALGRPATALEQFHELERILKEELDAAPSATTRELAREISDRLSLTSDQLSVGSRQSAVGRKRKGELASLRVGEHQPTNSQTHQPATHQPLGSLPLQFTRFFGREEEIAQLQQWLLSLDTRLVTLTGLGGNGKTRLAIEVARRLREGVPGGVWFVPLSDLSDPRLIVGAVLDTLHIPRSPDVEPIDQVVEVLSRQPASLILDNVEHLLSADFGSGLNGLGCGESPSNPLNPLPKSADIPHPSSLILTLLERVSTLKLLVTSRQRLGIGGEREFPVPPLPTPHETGKVHPSSLIPHPSSFTPESLLSFPSVQLFVDRAQAVKPDFQVTARNAPAVAALCQRLEGIPLAIELAAARALVLTPTEMLKHLERRFDFLVSRRRDVAERHRTLRAAIDWSYHLLSPELQRFFARLSVFRGGWTLEAAEVTCFAEDAEIQGCKDAHGDSVPTSLHPCIPVSMHPANTLDLLAQLRECSLVMAEEAGDRTRYRMLETLRTYGWERLIESQELEPLRERHGKYFLALSEEAESQLEGEEQGEWLEHLEAENDNLRAAIEWGLESDPSSALRLAGALGRFWEVRGYWAEGREVLEKALESEVLNPKSEIRNPKWDAARAKALRWAGHLTYRQGDYQRARGLLEESVKLSRAAEDLQGMASALNSIGGVAHAQGDYACARALCEESLSLYRKLGDKSGIAWALHYLGNAARYQGDYAQAHTCYEECLAIRRELGDKRGIAFSLESLGNVARFQGDYARARALCEESLALRRELGDKGGIAWLLENLGAVAMGEGNYAQAHALCEESLAIHQELGNKGGVAWALHRLGSVARYRGDYARTRACYEESLAIRRELGDKRGIAFSLEGLGDVARLEGDCAQAFALCKESLTTWRDSGDKRGIAECLERLAQIACAQGQAERAARWYAAAEALRETIGAPVPPADRADHERDVAAIRSTLSKKEFAAAWAQGRALTGEQAAADALDSPME